MADRGAQFALYLGALSRAPAHMLAAPLNAYGEIVEQSERELLREDASDRGIEPRFAQLSGRVPRGFATLSCCDGLLRSLQIGCGGRWRRGTS